MRLYHWTYRYRAEKIEREAHIDASKYPFSADGALGVWALEQKHSGYRGKPEEGKLCVVFDIPEDLVDLGWLKPNGWCIPEAVANRFRVPGFEV